MRLAFAALLVAVLSVGTAISGRLPRTYIYVGGRNVGYVEGAGGFWSPSWSLDLPGSIEKASRTRFFSGCEAESGENRVGTAHRVAWNSWSVSSFPRFEPQGSLRLVASHRWAMFNVHGRKVGETRGRNGVVAGLAWLTISYCR